MKKNRLIKIASLLFSILFWILIWALLAYKINIDLLLPSPLDTLKAIASLASSADFWQITALSILRILIGIIIAVIVGVLLAMLTANLTVADSLLSPLMTVIKATPVASFIILALLWIDRNTLPVFITVLIVLPIVWANISQGIRAVDKDLLDVAKVYRFPFAKRLTKVYIPSVMPYFLAACRASLGMAWKAGIAAEVLCTPQNAIGTQIYLSKTYIETTELFAWTLVVILLSVTIEKLLIFSLSRIAKKLRIERSI